MADDSKPTPKELAALKAQKEAMDQDALNTKGAKSKSTKSTMGETVAEFFGFGKGDSATTTSPQKESNRDRFNRSKEELGLKKGGSVSSRGDGIAQRGKTKGRFV